MEQKIINDSGLTALRELLDSLASDPLAESIWRHEQDLAAVYKENVRLRFALDCADRELHCWYHKPTGTYFVFAKDGWEDLAR